MTLVLFLLSSLGCTSITIIGSGNQVTVEKGTTDDIEADKVVIEK